MAPPSRRGSLGSGPIPSHPSSRRSSFASPQRLSNRPHTPSSRPPIPSEGPLTPSSRHHSPGLQSTPSRPLSDAMLIDSFSPQERRFYKWFLDTEDQRDDLLGFISDPGAYDRFHEEAWPDPMMYKAYQNWAGKWLGRHFDRMDYRMPDEEFFEQL